MSFVKKGRFLLEIFVCTFPGTYQMRKCCRAFQKKAFSTLNATYLTQLAKAAGNFLTPIYFLQHKAWDRVHIFTFNSWKINFVHKIDRAAPTEAFLLQYSERTKIHTDSNVFRCSDGSYIDILWICDGIADCFSASDEHFCICTFVGFDNNQTDYCQKIIDGDTHTCSALYIKNAKGDCLNSLKLQSSILLQLHKEMISFFAMKLKE